MPEWTGSDQLGAICGIFVVLATIIFTIRFFLGLKNMGKQHTEQVHKIVS